MTQEALELQENAVKQLLYLAQHNQKDITLKAPTGSGKTRMMAAFMHGMLDFDSSIIFLVSTLSKGSLATQNYESFVELASACIYPNLKPFYISSGAESKNTEYSLDIDTSANVYVLPTNQFTKSSRIYKERALLKFLQNIKENGKKIMLIRDEAHIATNKLENELQEYFTQTLHFSATPKKDTFDVEIKESEAVKAGLIKSVEWCKDSGMDLQADLTKALEKFKSLKKVYAKQGINPCCIVQISNEGKAEEELEIVKEVIEEKDLRWVCFVEKEKDYESGGGNSRLEKVKNKSLWQNYVKEDSSFIDVVIFKMVITEGFDMPRACMLYQVRNSQSKQLDWQVIGRVRRNPCLSYFEKLDKETQEIFSKAYVYGIKPKEDQNKRIKVQLKGEIHEGLFKNEIIKEFDPFTITKLKEVPLDDIDISGCLKEDALEYYDTSIFKAYRKLQTCSDKVKEKQKEFVDSYEKWFLFNANLDSIKEKTASVVENYEKYGEVLEVGLRDGIYSFFYGSGKSMFIDSWIWTNDGDEFSFDSKAEEEWFKILNTMKNNYCKSIEIKGGLVYLFGKNFLDKSNVKFDYYHMRKHTSYPDFIFKDKQNRVHLFEVKSVNQGVVALNEKEYKTKIEKLREAYNYASKKTGYIFYLPVQINDGWKIWKYENGACEALNIDGFKAYMKC